MLTKNSANDHKTKVRSYNPKQKFKGFYLLFVDASWAGETPGKL